VTTAYVPRDSAARSVGADEVAAALQRSGVEVVRIGSRGMLWLEPLVEVETPAGRIGYGQVTPEDVPHLRPGHAKGIGLVEEHPWLTSQQRVTFARMGRTDPLSLDDYVAGGGMAGLRKARTMTPAQVVAEVTESGLRGRGGAGFPAGIKWRTVLDAPGEEKFVCCNADEGDSGTFADRMILEGDPFMLI
jgi:formate dehydrogenase iron-sulfur subunit